MTTYYNIMNNLITTGNESCILPVITFWVLTQILNNNSFSINPLIFSDRRYNYARGGKFGREVSFKYFFCTLSSLTWLEQKAFKFKFKLQHILMQNIKLHLDHLLNSSVDILASQMHTWRKTLNKSYIWVKHWKIKLLQMALKSRLCWVQWEILPQGHEP